MSIGNGGSASASTSRAELKSGTKDRYHDDASLGPPVVRVDIVGEDRPQVKMKMLIAEDALVNQQALRFFFDDGNTELTFVENGQLAIDAVQKSEREGRQYDILLMDMVMPVMDGYVATAKLRQLGYELPIIALTGSGSEDDRSACVKAGCTEYASKAVDLDVLLEVIEKLTVKH